MVARKELKEIVDRIEVQGSGRYKASNSIVKDIVETTTKLDEYVEQASITPRKEAPVH